MRIALLTEGGYPFAHGESVAWCDRLLRGLGGHEFEIYAFSRSARQEHGPRCELPGNVRLLRTAPLWDATGERRGRPYGRRRRRRFAECFGELAAALCGEESDGDSDGERDGDRDGGGPADAGRRPSSADRFADGLYGLAELARDHGAGLRAALRSEPALRTLESACRAPGAPQAVRAARITDLFAVSERLERALRPLSLDWYGPQGLDDVDLCHAVGGGTAALPGLVAKRFFGTPLLITEYGTRGGRGHGPGAGPVAPAAAGASVRALLASFQRQLTCEAYARAELITSGDSQERRRQLRRGAPERRLRTVYPGLDAAPFAELGERAERGPAGHGGGDEHHGDGEQHRGGDGADEGGADAEGATLVWTGRIEPEKDVVGLLYAFAEVRRAVPEARLRIVASGPGRGAQAREYEADCRDLAERLFRCEQGSAGGRGGELPVGCESPVDGEPPVGSEPPVSSERRVSSEHPVSCESPVSFEEPGCRALPAPADVHGAGCVVVFTGSAEGFPVPLAEAMLSGRATVSTDVGLVREVIGGTGLVVPPRDARALAAGCTALLRDPQRRERLGAAARERALELFTVEQNVAAFRGIYLELLSRRTGGADAAGPRTLAGLGLPFARPPESLPPESLLPETVPPETPPPGGRPYEAAAEPASEPPSAPAYEPVPETSSEPGDGTAPPRVARRRPRPLTGGRRPRRRGAGR